MGEWGLDNSEKTYLYIISMLQFERGDVFYALFFFLPFLLLHCRSTVLIYPRDSQWPHGKHCFDSRTLILIKASVSLVMAHCFESSWGGEGQ